MRYAKLIGRSLAILWCVALAAAMSSLVLWVAYQAIWGESADRAKARGALLVSGFLMATGASVVTLGVWAHEIDMAKARSRRS